MYDDGQSPEGATQGFATGGFVSSETTQKTLANLEPRHSLIPRHTRFALKHHWLLVSKGEMFIPPDLEGNDGN